MGRRIGLVALLAVAGCAGREQAVVKPSALDPALAPLDREAGRSLAYPVVAIERFDGFLGEAARVEATIGLARRLGGELRTAVVELATAHGVPRAEQRPWTALAGELAARGDLTDAERDRLKRSAGPLWALLPHLGTVPGRAERLVTDGTALLDGAGRDASPDEAGRLAPALDALNVALARLRDARARAPGLADELRAALDQLAKLGPVRPPSGPGPSDRDPAPASGPGPGDRPPRAGPAAGRRRPGRRGPRRGASRAR